MKTRFTHLYVAVLLSFLAFPVFAQHSAGAVPAGLVPSGDAPASAEQAVNPAVRTWNSQNGPYFSIFDSTTPGVVPVVAPFAGDGSFIGAGEFVGGLSYMVNVNSIVYVLDDAGVQQNTYAATIPPNGETYSGMALNPVDGTVYAASTNVFSSTLFTFDVLTGSAVAVGPIVGSPGIIAIAFDGSGNLFGYDIVTDSFFQINPATGATSNVVPLPFDANFGQGMMYDPLSGLLYILAFNNGTFQGELWTVDTSNPGAPVFNFDGILGNLVPGGLNQLSWGGTDVGGEPPAFARFLVTKDFDDDNTAEVEVTLSCNTGLPLQQSTTISEGDSVNFVIGDFEQGTLNCSVTEVVPGGYTASYNDGTVSPDNCSWEALTGGQYACSITNTLNQVEVEVTKVWIDENPQFNAQNVANADWSCSNVAFGPNDGFLQFEGNPGVDSFFVYPDWDTGTTCSVTEVILLESGVEVDDSDCQGIVVFPGVDGSCTIFNTRLYEGIPTLSQYGLAILALLMLGVGFVAVRRFV